MATAPTPGVGVRAAAGQVLCEAPFLGLDGTDVLGAALLTHQGRVLQASGCCASRHERTPRRVAREHDGNADSAACVSAGMQSGTALAVTAGEGVAVAEMLLLVQRLQVVFNCGEPSLQNPAAKLGQPTLLDFATHYVQR